MVVGLSFANCPSMNANLNKTLATAMLTVRHKKLKPGIPWNLVTVVSDT